MGREKSGNFIFPLKVRAQSANFFQNTNWHETSLILLSIIENVCEGIHQYERTHVILQETDFIFLGFTLAE